MDYVVGGVAALISGNVTPNRPRAVKRALTPTKHPVSPNVTPKSEIVGDRSIFLSPTMQKKKSIVKKSPKRIFHNQDLDATLDGDAAPSPKADKVKKHLKGDLDTISAMNESDTRQTSPKKKRGKSQTPLKVDNVTEEAVETAEPSPKKKKKLSVSISEDIPLVTDKPENDSLDSKENVAAADVNKTSKKRNRKKNKGQTNSSVEKMETDSQETAENTSKATQAATNTLSKSQKRRNRKRKKAELLKNTVNETSPTQILTPTKKNKKSEPATKPVVGNQSKKDKKQKTTKIQRKDEPKKAKIPANPNTDKDSDSEESDDDLDSDVEDEDDSAMKPVVENQSKKAPKPQKPKIQEPVKTKEEPKNKAKILDNPKAVTDQDSESEESDDDLDSDDEEEDESDDDSATEPVVESQSKKAHKDKKPKTHGPIQTEEPKKKAKNLVNPNAVTDKDSESEHESDDDLDSDDEDDGEEEDDGDDDDDAEDKAEVEENSDSENEDVEAPEPTANAAESSDDDDEDEKEGDKKEHNKEPEKETEALTEEELKRTLFVGNVPFGAKCKKDIKRLFSKYGQIETVRIRNIPIKDPRDTPKLAVIKNELHPDRSTVNVYVKFADAEAREMALAENNTVLNKCHLRVTRSDTTGAEYDHRLAVYIGNLPFALEDEALRERFEKCGEIESVRIVRDKKTNVGKGFGYVNFKSKDGVELALALSEEDRTIKNKILRVQRCIQGGAKSSRPARGGSRGRGGPHRGGHSRDSSFNDRSNSSDRGGFSRGGGRGFGPVRGRGGQHRGGFGQDTRFGGDRGGRGGFGGDRGGRGGFGGDRGGRGGFGGDRGSGRGFGPPRGRGGRGRDFDAPRGRGGFRGGGGGDRGRGRGGSGGSWGDRNGGSDGGDGAHRRIFNKRKNEEGGGDGPPSKFQRDEQPPREKKEKKEFVGMTAEKKKKQTFSKDQKKKKAFSEILTK